MKRFTFEIETQKTSPDFTILRESDGLTVISNRTGNHYALLEGIGTSPAGKQYTSDIMFIMQLVPSDYDDGYMFADEAYVNYTFGAGFIMEFDPDALQGLFQDIYDFENK